MARSLFEAYPRIVDANGAPVSGGKAYYYEAGTTTPITTYSDSGLSSAQTHPVVADSSGVLPQIYVADDQTYKVVLTDADDVTLVTIDNIQQNFLATTAGFLGIQESSPQEPLVVGRLGADVSHSGLQVATTIATHPGIDPAANTSQGSAITILGGNTSTNGVYFADPEDNDAGAVIYNHSANELTIRAAGANILTVTSTGFKINGGTAMTAYTEGSFTPVIADAASGGNEATASVASGIYCRVGRLVHIAFVLEDIDTTGLTGANDIFITGLPFTSRNVTASRYTSLMRSNSLTYSDTPFLYISQNSSYARIMQNASGAASDFLTVSALASGTADLYCDMTYIAE